ncbi:MAG: hypothetical protein LBH29_04510 [Elusimicrobiota bacterium]|jgi:predicted RNase H-like HicB family nuclease|nr:hypothetical protein [Elusimicrobiota bacterium]
MKQSKLIVSNNKVISVSAPVYFFRAGKNKKTIFADCPSLAISTYGNSLKHAKSMFQEALDIWVEHINSKGNIISVLKELKKSIFVSPSAF